MPDIAYVIKRTQSKILSLNDLGLASTQSISVQLFAIENELKLIHNLFDSIRINFDINYDFHYKHKILNGI